MGCKFKYNGQTYESEADLKAVLRQELKANTAKVRDGDLLTHPVTKIISGAQTGVDMAGLDAAQEVNISTGGTAAAKWQQSTEGNKKIFNPALATKYGLKEGKITKRFTQDGKEYDDVYYQRTLDNAQEADGTIWFGNAASPGGKLTLNRDTQKGKPRPLINPTSAQEIRNWLNEHNIKTLNVAGNREHTNPGIYDKAKTLLVDALKSNTENKNEQSNTTVKPGVEISSNAKGLAAALTNPTELAKSKGNLTQSYPVTFKGKTYKDSEEAYQALKSTATKDNGPNSTYNLMVDIIKAKLEQHPRLITEITNQGGSAWILSSTHQPTRQNSVWETGGKNWFIKALNDAYIAVTPSTTQQPKTVDIERNFVELENNILDFEPKVQKLFNAPTIELYDEVIGNYEYDLSADIDNSLRKDIESKLRDVKKSFTVTKPQQKITDAEVEAMTEALVEMYPEIELGISNTPQFQNRTEKDSVFNQRITEQDDVLPNDLSFERVEAVSNMIMNKLAILSRPLTKRDFNKAKVDIFYKNDTAIKNDLYMQMLTNILDSSFASRIGGAYPDAALESILNEDLKERLKSRLEELTNNNPYVKNKEALDELKQNYRLLESFMKHKDVSAINRYDEEQQKVIRSYLSEVYSPTKNMKFKTEKQKLIFLGNMILKKMKMQIRTKESNLYNLMFRMRALTKKYETLIDFIDIVPNYKELITDKLNNAYDRVIAYKNKNISDEKTNLKRNILFKAIYNEATFMSQEFKLVEAAKHLPKKKNVSALFPELADQNTVTTDVVTTLQRIIDGNGKFSALAASFLPFAEKNNMRLTVTDEYTGSKNTSAHYSVKTAKVVDKNTKEFLNDTVIDQYIEVNIDSAAAIVQPEQIILHEITHSLTTIAINSTTFANNPAYTKLLDYIVKNINEHDVKTGGFMAMFSTPYGIKNPDELFAEALTNSEFQEVLKSIPPMDKKQFRNLFEEIVDFIASLFNIKEYSNVYEQLEEVIYATMSNQSKYAFSLEQLSKELDKNIDELEVVLKGNHNDRDMKQLNIQFQKEGVSELFESNPELANAVYEALGFKQNINKEIAKSKNNTDEYRFSIGDFVKGKNSVRVTKNNEGDFSIHEGDLSELTKEKKVALFKEQSNIIPIGGKIVQRGASSFDGIRHRINLKNHGFSIEYQTDNLQEYKSTNKKEVQEFANLYNLGKVIEKDGKLFTKGVILTKEENIDFITLQQKQQAQLAYSQYLDSLNKPNTNPILQNNQQEQVKKFAELQERLNNKEFLEGAKNAYENSEGLKSFGTQEQYNDYIARVSLGIIKNPSSGEYNYTSKVKDIVYHGTTNFQGDTFKKVGKRRQSTELDAFYFAQKKQYAELMRYYAEFGAAPESVENMFEFGFSDPEFKTRYSNTKLIPAILNIKTPQKLYSEEAFKDNLSPEIVEKDKDGIIREFPVIEETAFTIGINNNEFIVFEPEQIHILGSKQDIEGFKEFITSQQNVFNQQSRDLKNIQFQKDTLDTPAQTIKEGGKSKIIGQADIQARKVLIDAAFKNKPDLVSHEFAHHYIAWFRNTPLVQQGIKMYGSEEALVQAIGEQAVVQRGKAWSWWKKVFGLVIKFS